MLPFLPEVELCVCICACVPVEDESNIVILPCIDAIRLSVVVVPSTYVILRYRFTDDKMEELRDNSMFSSG